MRIKNSNNCVIASRDACRRRVSVVCRGGIPSLVNKITVGSFEADQLPLVVDARFRWRRFVFLFSVFMTLFPVLAFLWNPASKMPYLVSFLLVF